MNKKIITIIFTLSTMLFLVGCSFTNNESNGSDKNYTYNDLDENQKEIIDNVYAELGDWGYTYEPSNLIILGCKRGSPPYNINTSILSKSSESRITSRSNSSQS